MDYLIDTNFLIGLWRQSASGPEARFLDAHSDAVLGLPWVAKGEFLSGAVIAEHHLQRVMDFLADFVLVWPDEGTVIRYARCYAALRVTRQTVGANDLWIAAAAIERDVPLLTRNVKELSRVEGLKVVDYGKA